MSFRRTLVVVVGAVVLVVLWHAAAYAEIEPAGVLDRVLDKYHAAASGWATVIQGAATRLFWSLATISMVWTFGMMALRRADAGEVIAEAARFSIVTGFHWWLLSNAPAMAASIQDSMRQLGAQASGLHGTMSPSTIVDVGFTIAATVFESASVWSPAVSGVAMIVALVILVVLALVAINMLQLLVASWFLAYAGIFFLGFGGARWTSEMAIGYYKAVLAMAAQLLGMVLLVGIGHTFIDEFAQAMSAKVKLIELAVILVVSVCLLVVTNRVPGVLATLAHGGGHVSHALGSGAGAGTAMTAAGLATAGVATGAALIGSAAANVGGAVQALNAAHGAARAEMGLGLGGASNSGSGGGGVLASVMGDSSAGSRSPAGVGGGRSSSGSSPSSSSTAAKKDGDRKQNATAPASGGGDSGGRKTSTGDRPVAAQSGSNETPRSGGQAGGGKSQSTERGSATALSGSSGENSRTVGGAAVPSTSASPGSSSENKKPSDPAAQAPAGGATNNEALNAEVAEDASTSKENAADGGKDTGSAMPDVEASGGGAQQGGAASRPVTPTSLEFDSLPAVEQDGGNRAPAAPTVRAGTPPTANGATSPSQAAQSDAAGTGASQAPSDAATAGQSGEHGSRPAVPLVGGRRLETAVRAAGILGRATIDHVKNAGLQRAGATVGGRLAAAIREQKREPPDAAEVAAFAEGDTTGAEENSISRGKSDE
jgi:type IV secretion system protein VirB6/type IV secretion system protein TrbL